MGSGVLSPEQRTAGREQCCPLSSGSRLNFESVDATSEERSYKGLNVAVSVLECCHILGGLCVLERCSVLGSQDVLQSGMFFFSFAESS